LINFKYEISLAPAFAFRCLSSLRSVGHLEASCPAPNANVHFTFKRDLVYPYEKGDSRSLINHILNVTPDLIGENDTKTSILHFVIPACEPESHLKGDSCN
jgi:hypothetical protein